MFIKKTYRVLPLFFGLFFLMSAASLQLQAGNQSAPSHEQNEHTPGTSNTYELIATHGETRADVATALQFLDHPEHIIRYREVTLEDVLTRSGQLAAGDLLQLNLFEDVDDQVEVRRTKTNVNGSFTVSARAPEGGVYLALATTEGRSLATIFIPERDQFFKIISDPSGDRHYLLEKRASDRDIIESGPPLIPEPDPEDIREQQRIRDQIDERNYGPDDMARIGVMVVYTPAARQWAQSGGGGIANVVALSMVNAQMTLDNSDTRAVMELVHSGEVDHSEGASSNSDLSALTDGTGSLAVAHEWREEYGADLVAIFAQVSDVGGLAWLLTNRHGLPGQGFSLTRVQQAAAGYTHIHEMGHNMGLHHHADQSTQPGPTNWSNWQENQWSAGWRWTGTEGGHFCSVMTYGSGQFFADGIDHTTVPYFSNPDITHAGVPAGNAQRGDNARTVREIKHVIAAYQPIDELTVVTNDTDSIRAFDAVTGGTVVDDGGEEVVERGIVWNSTGEPHINNNEGQIEKGTGSGAYHIRLTGLEETSTYYVRAYAITGSQTRYGHTREFTTKTALSPEVNTRDILTIGHSWAEAGGNVVFDGNTEVSERGVVWSTQPNPTLDNHEGISQDGAGEGIFTSKITDLQPETEYHYRAYATNFTETSYGEEQSFTTLLARVFPNPASDVLHVEFQNQVDEEVRIRLITPEGQVAKKRTIQGSGNYQGVFQVHHLRAGMYYLEINSSEEFPVWPVMISPQR